MKSTMNISISGIAFTLESDAYDALNKYMKQIERAYNCDSASAEIISDIEARISELALSWQSEHSTIVTKECIDAIIAQMGTPEEPSASGQPTESTHIDNETTLITRRLYRNSQGSRLGGVLNGLASYFNIDVTLLRIVVSAIFVACVFIGHHQGTTLPIIIIAYVGLWMIVPMAKNARQKMEMQGQPITAETISSNIKDELNSISRNDKNEKTASIFTNLIYAIGKVIRFFFLCIASVVGITVVAMLITAIGVGCAIVFEGQESVKLFVDTNPIWATTLATLCVVIPLLFILYTIIKMFFSFKWNRWVLGSLFSLWIISWALGAYTFGTNIYDYSQPTSTTERSQYSLIGDTLTIDPTGNYTSEKFDWKAGIYRDKVRLYISENNELSKSEVKIKLRRRSSGRTTDDAINNCNSIKFDYTLTDNTLSFPSVITYKGDESQLYRGQGVVLDVEVASGTTVVVPESYYNHFRGRIFDYNDDDIEKNYNNGNIYIKQKSNQEVIDTVKTDTTQETKTINDKTETKSTTTISTEKEVVKKETVSIKDGKVVTTTK